MRVKCDYCETWINDTEERCPSCGAPNKAYTRMADATPKTIQQLRQWYQDRGLPPEKTTRFFIGKDVKEAKAFGIYQEGEYFVVYKNKADGTRAVRYKGKDEAYAVHEIYTKLKEEILNQRARQTSGNRPTRSSSGSNRSYQSGSSRSYQSTQSTRPKGCLGCLTSVYGLAGMGILSLGGLVSNYDVAPILTLALALVPIIAFLVYTLLCKKKNESQWDTVKKWFIRLYIPYLLIAMLSVSVATEDRTYVSSYTPAPTYYSYNDTTYCSYNDNYYYYNGTDYEPVYDISVIEELSDNGDDYYFDSSYVDWNSDYSFYDSDYYDDNFYTSSSSSSSSSYSSSYSSSSYDYSYSSSSDSSWDWSSSSSWDSGSSDWDSDW